MGAGGWGLGAGDAVGAPPQPPAPTPSRPELLHHPVHPHGAGLEHLGGGGDLLHRRGGLLGGGKTNDAPKTLDPSIVPPVPAPPPNRA